MKYVTSVSMIVLLALTGCATPPTPRERGIVGGAAIGAVTGAVLGGIAGDAGKGAAIGAAVGAVTGGLTGDAIQSEQADRARAPRYASPPYPPSSGSLQIELAPEDAEILVDGRRIGVAKDFYGSGMVPVAAGFHLVEFHWRGFSVTNHIVVAPQTTVPIRRNLASSAQTSPENLSPGAYR